MDQSQQSLKEWKRPRLLTRTDNTQKLRQSLLPLTITSNEQLTNTMDRAEIVHWVSESARPFEIVSDHGFQSLMKTGRPGYYIPSPSPVSRDVRMVFACTCQRIANMLQVSERFNAETDTLRTTVKGYAGELSFAPDACTSPN